MKPIEDIWIQMGCRQVDLFEQDQLAYMNLLVTGLVIRPIMLNIYLAIVKFKIVPRIEDLPIEEKSRLWEQAKDIAANRLKHNQCVELSKALYTLQCFLTK